MVPLSALSDLYFRQSTSTKKLLARINKLNKRYMRMDDAHLRMELKELIVLTQDEVIGWLKINNSCYMKGEHEGVWSVSLQRLYQRASLEVEALDELKAGLTYALKSVDKDDAFFYDPEPSRPKRRK